MAVTRSRAAPAQKAASKSSKATEHRVTDPTVTASTKSTPLPTADLDLPAHAFTTAADFEAFLDREHLTCPGIHVKCAKKSSGVMSITRAEAVEVALCFGWIDSQGKSFDDKYYLQRFTPRRQKSIWSQKNVDAVERLIEEGRMREAGMASVEAAQQDGRWQRAYARPSDITVPTDFEAALDKQPAAKALFETLSKGQRYSVLVRIEMSTPSARPRRINALVGMLAAGTVPGDDARVKARARAAVKRAAVKGMVQKGKKMAIVGPNGMFQQGPEKSRRSK